ncbi:nuclear transport factor 2 family protein [Streptomyces sp. NPDC088197]|uniref:nuclear transport factor 2 family protein n=1 Tax=Streptomyces sp. NPDC088197 TaxID=3365840 RepID=UPI003800581F
MTTATGDPAASLTELTELTDRWADVERTGDADALAALVTDDLTTVGPFGFVLDRGQWLDRYRGGDLVTYAFDWTLDSIRVHGDTVIGIGHTRHDCAHRGQRARGDSRVTVVAVDADRDASGNGGDSQLGHAELPPA